MSEDADARLQRLLGGASQVLDGLGLFIAMPVMMREFSSNFGYPFPVSRF